MISALCNFVGFNTEISAPESTRKVHLELKFWDVNITKLDKAVVILKICLIGVADFLCCSLLLGRDLNVVFVVVVLPV